jgi:hypothetical protein
MDSRFEVVVSAGTMVVDEVAEIPRAIRAGATVQRIG